MNVSRNKIVLLLAIVLAGATFAQATGLTALTCGLISLCQALTTMLPIAAMLMLVLAGVIYAAGQMMGAETRARANVWATACLTGALIGILIVVIAPPILDMMYTAPAGAEAVSISTACFTGLPAGCAPVPEVPEEPVLD